MISRRMFLQASAAAMMLETFNFRTDMVLAVPDALLDTSELPGMDALKWYAQQLVLIDPNDDRFGLERESKEFGSFPYKVNGSPVYMEDPLYLHITRPDYAHEFVMAYMDSNGEKRVVTDVWLKGHLGEGADRVTFIREIDGSTEESSWYGHGGYSILRYRPRRNDDGYGEHLFSKFGIDGTIYSEKVLEDIAYFDTSRAPLLTGTYEGKHEEFLARGVQLLIESNADYRKNLQQIIRELEKEGKIRL